MNSDKNPVEYYNEAVEMLQTMRQEMQAKLEDIEGIKTKLFITDTKLQLTQTELKETQVKLKATENYIDNTLVGSVTPFAITTPPEGWLICNGEAISRTTYVRLFEKIGTTFGQGDSQTTFNLPDLRGVFIRGWDTDNRFDLKREFGSYQDDQIQSHTHQDSGHSHNGSVSDNGSHHHSSSISSAGNHSHYGSIVENGSHNHGGIASIDGEHFHRPRYGNLLEFYPKEGTSVFLSSKNGGRFSSCPFSIDDAGAHSHNLLIKHAGSHSHNLNINSTGSHSHNLDINSSSNHSHTISINDSSASLGNPANSGLEKIRHGNETRTKNLALIYCIKY